MSISFTIRDARPEEAQAIAELNTRAFGRPDEAVIVARLEKDGDVAMQIVAEMDGQIVGHALFYSVRVFGKLGGIGLGPMCVEPWIQREGIGKALLNYGLTHLQKEGVSIVFVVGHPEYYPKSGFSQEAAKDFESPYKGPHFMAVRLRYGPPMSGRLIFPDAFGPPPAAA
jgi:putative acetyltransferase